MLRRRTWSKKKIISIKKMKMKILTFLFFVKLCDSSPVYDPRQNDDNFKQPIGLCPLPKELNYAGNFNHTVLFMFAIIWMGSMKYKTQVLCIALIPFKHENAIHELLSNEGLSNEILSMFILSKRLFIEWSYYQWGVFSDLISKAFFILPPFWKKVPLDWN